VKWLLDTNVVSEGVRSRPHSKVVRWISSQPREYLSLSAVTLAELRNGAATANSEALRTTLTRWIESNIVTFFDGQMLPLTVDILVDWIGVSRSLRMIGKTRDAADMLIASTARVHGLTVVTRNIRDFADTGVVVYDPWNNRTHRMDQP
jgi:hypothetical protein